MKEELELILSIVKAHKQMTLKELDDKANLGIQNCRRIVERLEYLGVIDIDTPMGGGEGDLIDLASSIIRAR